MNWREKVAWYYREYGLLPLLKRAFQVIVGAEARHPRQADLGLGAGYTPRRAAAEAVVASGALPAAASLIESRFAAIQPLPVFSAPGPESRLNLVTDSINEGSLFGGVATAILLSAQLAKARGSVLRVVTRTQEAHQAGFAHVLQCNEIEVDGNVEFAYIGVDDPLAQLDVCPGDRFLTTSWWTTACVLGSIAPSRVDYLLQEDERMFYPHGDDWQRCSEVLARDDIRFVVNTELLHRHFVSSGLQHFSSCATWFEPAFPMSTFRASRDLSSNEGRQRRRLFFYARPNNLRNLFYRGVEALDRAVARGIVDPDRWDIIFVGKDIPRLTLAGIMEPEVAPTMSWREYGAFVRTVDLGFCLMATPHPSYPPLDLAAAGAVVVTNRFGLKQDLSAYSQNILLADLEVDRLVDGLARGIALVEDADKRSRQYAMSGMSRSWAESLEVATRFLA